MARGEKGSLYKLRLALQTGNCLMVCGTQKKALPMECGTQKKELPYGMWNKKRALPYGGELYKVGEKIVV